MPRRHETAREPPLPEEIRDEIGTRRSLHRRLDAISSLRDEMGTASNTRCGCPRNRSACGLSSIILQTWYTPCLISGGLNPTCRNQVDVAGINPTWLAQGN